MSQERLSPEDEALYQEARRRYAAKHGLLMHALVFVLVNAGLVGVNLLTTPRFLWFVYPLFGWGVGLLAHAISTWRIVSGGRERGIEAEVRRLKAQRERA